MANKMKRGAAFERPEPMRKRARFNHEYNPTVIRGTSASDRAKLLKANPLLAEISVSKALTADEKRIEMGKAMLAAASKRAKSDDIDDETMITDTDVKPTTEAIHRSLMDKVLQKEGKFKYRIAEKLRAAITVDPNCIKIKSLRGHRLAVSAMALSPDDSYVVTGSKDGSIIKWDLKTGERIAKVWHAWPTPKGRQLSNTVRKKLRPQPVLALGISPDGKYLVSGGEDHLIRVWLADKMRYKATFKGHRAAVTGLAFSATIDKTNENAELLDEDDIKPQITLFTTGADRQIRVYDMGELGFAEPLFGHTLPINNIDATTDDRCLTVSDDRTVRYWRLKNQSQLIFHKNGHDSNIDTCCLLTPGKFISGSEDGSIAMWSTQKKFPLFKAEDAHSTNDNQTRHWVTALSAKPHCDVFSSGASDGIIRLWAVRNNSFTHIRSVAIPKGGFINAMRWTAKGDRIICAVGNEHRLGRWDRVKGARNGICIIQLPFAAVDDDESVVTPIENTNDSAIEDSNDDNDDDDDMKTNDVSAFLGTDDASNNSSDDSDTNASTSMTERPQKRKKERKQNRDRKIRFDTAAHWDRWAPEETGKVKPKNIKSEKDISDDSKEVPLSDEWVSFFGTVFGQ